MALLLFGLYLLEVKMFLREVAVKGTCKNVLSASFHSAPKETTLFLLHSSMDACL